MVCLDNPSFHPHYKCSLSLRCVYMCCVKYCISFCLKMKSKIYSLKLHLVLNYILNSQDVLYSQNLFFTLFLKIVSWSWFSYPVVNKLFLFRNERKKYHLHQYKAQWNPKTWQSFWMPRINKKQISQMSVQFANPQPICKSCNVSCWYNTTQQIEPYWQNLSWVFQCFSMEAQQQFDNEYISYSTQHVEWSFWLAIHVELATGQPIWICFQTILSTVVHKGHASSVKTCTLSVQTRAYSDINFKIIKAS